MTHLVAGRMMTHTFDLAISAVSYDTLLVAELAQQLAPRLWMAPIWVSDTLRNDEQTASPLVEELSRVALVLHQRLWGHDDATRLDAELLRERVRGRQTSVIVASLDDAPLPGWLSSARTRDLRTAGLEGITQWALDVIADAGGAVRGAAASKSKDVPETRPRWPEPPTPFLQQLRAHSVLRRELDSLSAELRPRLKAEEVRDGDRTIELHSLPNRLIARLDDAGVSFSWVPGRAGTVADGRLLVIEWSGVASERHGVAALKAATPVRERIYRAEAETAEEWRWRADDPNGRACSTANLVGEWLAGASMASNRASAATDVG